MRLGFGPQDWDLGLKAGIWASRLSYGPGSGGWGTEKEEEKIPLCGSIGHRPLRGRCPKRRIIIEKSFSWLRLFSFFRLLEGNEADEKLITFFV